jgi:hypothetical protein
VASSILNTYLLLQCYNDHKHLANLKGLYVWQKLINWLRQVLPLSINVVGGEMPSVTVAILNASTTLSDAEITPIVLALQIQVSRDFAPIYGTSANLIQVKRGQKPPHGAWQLGFFDDSDTAGALGYHDVTPEGLPLGKVFAKTDKLYGLSSSVTASHELLEMLADSGCELTVQMDSQSFTAYEVCDPVEDDSLGYPIVLPHGGGSVKVSDFVYPPWFMTDPPINAKFDKCGHVKAQFELAEGGYMSVWTPAGGWGQNTKGSDHRRHVVGSRMEKRINRDRWKVSNPTSPGP